MHEIPPVNSKKFPFVWLFSSSSTLIVLSTYFCFLWSFGFSGSLLVVWGSVLLFSLVAFPFGWSFFQHFPQLLRFYSVFGPYSFYGLFILWSCLRLGFQKPSSMLCLVFPALSLQVSLCFCLLGVIFMLGVSFLYFVLFGVFVMVLHVFRSVFFIPRRNFHLFSEKFCLLVKKDRYRRNKHIIQDKCYPNYSSKVKSISAIK